MIVLLHRDAVQTSHLATNSDLASKVKSEYFPREVTILKDRRKDNCVLTWSLSIYQEDGV